MATEELEVLEVKELTNRFVIDGIVCKDPVLRKTKSGLHYRIWFFQHQSNQYVQGILRKTWLRVEVMVVGNELVELTNNIKTGSKLRCSGHLTSRKETRGDTTLLMYADQIQELVELDEEGLPKP